MRRGLGLGRLLPLGGPGDGAWVAESAAVTVLRQAVAGPAGVRLGRVRVALADPEAVAEPAVPAPPSALPPGGLRVTADLAATAEAPLPVTASRVRVNLTGAAERLGLTVTEIDLRVTELLDEAAGPAPAADPAGPVPDGVPRETSRTAADDADTAEARAGRAALAVPGVTGLTGFLGRAVHIDDGPRREAELPRRHVRVEVAVAGDRRPVEVARAVRAAVTEALEERPTVAVLVTAVE